MFLLKTVVLTLVVFYVNGARILSIFPLPSPSHHILVHPLLKVLSLRGHQVTMLSPNPLKQSQGYYEDIYVDGSREFKEQEVKKHVMAYKQLSLIEKLPATVWMLTTCAEVTLKSQALKNITSSKEYDLVILFLVHTESLLGIAHHFKAPVIGFSTFGTNTAINAITGNPSPYSYFPPIFFGLPDEMNFYQRLVNTIGSTIYEIIIRNYVWPKQERLLHEHFPNAPSLNELIQNVSVVLINSHYSIEGPRPLLPNMIPVGGLHIEEPKELPKDIKKFLDGAKDGVVYFSLGTNIVGKDVTEEKINAIVKAFARLPQRVLWKFDNVNLKVSENVKIANWLPQNDVLAHPNIKLFITHGGLLSTTEAVYYGIPLIGIPAFADQETNVADSVNKGYAIKIDIKELNEEVFYNAIKEITENSRYWKNVQMRSHLLKQQPVKPLDRAIFWVEHVIKFKGAPYIQSVGSKLQWYQYYLLDVIGTIVITLTIILYVIFWLLRTVIRSLKSQYKIKVKTKTN